MHYVQDAVNQLSSLCIKGNEYLTNVGVVLINLFEWVWFINSCYLYSDEDKLASSVAIPEVSPPVHHRLYIDAAGAGTGVLLKPTLPNVPSALPSRCFFTPSPQWSNNSPSS